MVSRIVDTPQPEHLQGWQVSAWANVNRHGDRNESHDHSGDEDTLWSGIYYVDPGEGGAPTSGHTRLEDRSGVPKEVIRNPDPFEREHSITPEPGLMVLFPGRLWHRVEPFLGCGTRITVAFNLSHRGFVIPSYSGNAAQGGLKRWMWFNFRGVMIPASFMKQRLRAVVTVARGLRILRGPRARTLPRGRSVSVP
jgi:Putative 2OG-Fe(II) oxygenase